MTVLLWLAVVLGAVVVFYVVQLVYLSFVLAWGDQATDGVAYYGRPPEERARFKERLRRHVRVLQPILRLLGRFSTFTFEKASFTFRGVAGPRGTCSPESFATGADYAPGPEDVFVVTQMKCGTTWMQHVVYQVLHRGAGDLVGAGSTLYAESPWLEARKSVSVEDAPLLGSERPSRLIKTHFPAMLCPDGSEARYIYVSRHPVSCFASCADFIASNAGALVPDLDVIEAWFCSQEFMWWGTWPAHVAGWWQRSRDRDNVLFVTFEEMLDDLGGVVRRVAEFLGVGPLTEDEMAAVVSTCGFRYMQDHADVFEMHPPHILAIDSAMFVRGSSDRYRDVPEETRERIGAWCSGTLAGSDFPLATLYPDVAALGET